MKYKSKISKVYFLFVICLFVDNFTSILLNYIEVNLPELNYFNFLSFSGYIIDILCLLFYFYSIAVIIKELTGKNIIILHLKSYISFVLILIFLLLILKLGLKIKFSVLNLSKPVIYLLLGYSITLCIYHYKDINDQYRRVVKTIYIIFSVGIPLIMFENSRELIGSIIPSAESIYTNLPRELFGPTVYLVLNLYAIIISSSFIMESGNKRSINEIIKGKEITKRELDVLELLLSGDSNIQIADKLYISEGTVKNYIYSIYKKMGVNSRLKLNKLLNP